MVCKTNDVGMLKTKKLELFAGVHVLRADFPRQIEWDEQHRCWCQQKHAPSHRKVFKIKSWLLCRILERRKLPGVHSSFCAVCGNVRVIPETMRIDTLFARSYGTVPYFIAFKIDFTVPGCEVFSLCSSPYCLE